MTNKKPQFNLKKPQFNLKKPNINDYKEKEEFVFIKQFNNEIFPIKDIIDNVSKVIGDDFSIENLFVCPDGNGTYSDDIYIRAYYKKTIPANFIQYSIDLEKYNIEYEKYEKEYAEWKNYFNKLNKEENKKVILGKIEKLKKELEFLESS